MAAPQFINLDLVLKSNSELSALAEHLYQRAFVLTHQEHEGQSLLVLADKGPAHDAQWCTQQFLAMIDKLPDAPRDIWTNCTSRTFSYGFYGGRDHAALDTIITADLLLEMGRIGADMGLTVYPYRLAAIEMGEDVAS